MKKISQELRKIYLDDLGIDIDNAPSSSSEAQIFADAKKLFIEEVHPLFVANWGEQWFKAAGIVNDFKSPACNLWFVTLYGLDVSHVARALTNYLADAGGGFPPNPFRFREYCKSIKEKETARKTENKRYQLLD
jgi:hypothetical protein